MVIRIMSIKEIAMTVQQSLRAILEAATTTEEKHAAIVALIDEMIGDYVPNSRDSGYYMLAKGWNEEKESMREKLRATR
jgi:hypothetical protein